MFVGVFSQPVSSFSKWKERGVNVLVKSESEGGTVAQKFWRQQASQMGFKYIDVPMDASDKDDPNLLALMHDDEIDRRILEPNWNAWKKEIDSIKKQALLDQRNAFLKTFNDLTKTMKATGKPVFINICGPTITANQWYTGENHTCILPQCDILSGDWYPRNNKGDSYPDSHVGLMLDAMVKWGGQKPLWAILECSDQDVGDKTLGRPPKPEEMEAQLAECVKRNVQGICWFPQRIGSGFKYDNLVDPQLAKVIEINRRFNPLTPTLTLEDRVKALELKLERMKGVL